MLCSWLALSAGCGRLGFDPVDNAVDKEQSDGAVGVVPSFSIAAGQEHTCATREGQLYCWGEQGGVGALGIDEVSGTKLSPVRVGIDSDWIQAAAGFRIGCASRESGSVWCWGHNGDLLSGADGAGFHSVPMKVGLLDAASLAALSAHACVITKSSELRCWGDNFENQLGLGEGGNPMDRFVPMEPLSDVSSWQAMMTGQGHTCAVATDGSLWCWGRNSQSQLGLGAGAAMQFATPQQVGAGTSWLTVAGGQTHTCAIASNGTLWCWGVNFALQLGIVGVDSVFEPTQVGSDTNWREVQVGAFASCGLRQDDSLWCWGRNDEGQLGHGDTEDREVPTKVGVSTDWMHVAVGRFHTCAIKRDNSMWCTGENLDGRLGVGDVSRRAAMTQVPFP